MSLNNIIKILVGILLGSFIFLFIMIPFFHKFLSKSNPVNSEILVVNGWIFDNMMDQAVDEFNRRKYTMVIVTGALNYAQEGYEKLKDRGIPEDILAVAAIENPTKKHKTFYEAFGLKKFLKDKKIENKSMNIVTSAVHGKKTFYIFKKVLGSDYRIGIIPCKSNNYDETKLWKSPLGIKVTVEYFIGYLYALIWNVHLEE